MSTGPEGSSPALIADGSSNSQEVSPFSGRDAASPSEVEDQDLPRSQNNTPEMDASSHLAPPAVDLGYVHVSVFHS